MVLFFMTLFFMCKFVSPCKSVLCVCVRMSACVGWCAFYCLYQSLHTQLYHITTLCNMLNVRFSFSLLRAVGNFTLLNGFWDV